METAVRERLDSLKSWQRISRRVMGIFIISSWLWLIGWYWIYSVDQVGHRSLVLVLLLYPDQCQG